MTASLSQAEQDKHALTAKWLAQATVDAINGAGDWIAHFNRLTGSCPAATFHINSAHDVRLDCRVSGVRYGEDGMVFGVSAEHGDVYWTREHAERLRDALVAHFPKGVDITSNEGSNAVTFLVPGWRQTAMVY